MPTATIPAAERVVYNRQQAADFFGVSVRTIDQWTKLGKLRCQKFGRNVRYLRDELLRVANEGIEG